MGQQGANDCGEKYRREASELEGPQCDQSLFRIESFPASFRNEVPGKSEGRLGEAIYDIFRIDQIIFHKDT